MTQNQMIHLIDNHKLDLDVVKSWYLNSGDLMIRTNSKNTILYSALFMG